MPIEDLFKVVKARFTDEQPEPSEHKDMEIPENLLFKCARAAAALCTTRSSSAR